ncbi:hypothetical protein Tco_0806819 [Tanacetum coccineum]
MVRNPRSSTSICDESLANNPSDFVTSDPLVDNERLAVPYPNSHGRCDPYLLYLRALWNQTPFMSTIFRGVVFKLPPCSHSGVQSKGADLLSHVCLGTSPLDTSLLEEVVPLRSGSGASGWGGLVNRRSGSNISVRPALANGDRGVMEQQKGRRSSAPPPPHPPPSFFNINHHRFHNQEFSPSIGMIAVGEASADKADPSLLPLAP